MNNNGIKATSESELKEILIDINELSKYLGVSQVMIQTWMTQGKLPFYRMGNRAYFKKSEIIKGY